MEFILEQKLMDLKIQASRKIKQNVEVGVYASIRHFLCRRAFVFGNNLWRLVDDDESILDLRFLV